MKKRTFVENALALLAIVTIVVIFGGAIALIVVGSSGRSGGVVETAEHRAERCAKPPEPRVRAKRSVLEPMIEGDSLARAGKITPVLIHPEAEEESRARGFRVAELQPGGLYDLVGLCDGDLIVAVAGQRLDTPEAAFDVYEKAKGLPAIEVRLLRGANTTTAAFTIVLE